LGAKQWQQPLTIGKWAEECFEWARQASDESVREQYASLGRVWLDCVARADSVRRNHVVRSSTGETRLTRAAVGEGVEYSPLALRSNEIWREIETSTGETLFVQCGCLTITGHPNKSMVHGVNKFFDNMVSSAERYGSSRMHGHYPKRPAMVAPGYRPAIRDRHVRTLVRFEVCYPQPSAKWQDAACGGELVAVVRRITGSRTYSVCAKGSLPNHHAARVSPLLRNRSRRLLLGHARVAMRPIRWGCYLLLRTLLAIDAR